ncbi:hydrogenase maturation protease [Legionella bononiensis]|uniref:Hydrogenase maturation protease n=1 Tax=Legionella bononiensis TaxID=2793102 RepID=A0ABS1W6M3_9GAMM|nr:hydrogenase maturation protease [Legionella bononiensis]MBL7478420.1 hydrogenase maturation protease [Legionella bononiensis]MBL7525017.1 hydrogenase maturation protease [Legionella bononiensis]MBL7561314.1 hydrogenase maturation protease [Legionella bononiensis]
MKRIKVLGIGSPFGDDQAGCKVAERLKQNDLIRRNCSTVLIEAHDRPGVRLLELMSQANRVFLIDAIQSGNQPGTVHRLINEEIFELNPMLSTHDMGVAQALALGRSLDELPEQIILYGIEIGPLEYHSELSKSVEKAINQTVVLLEKELLSTVSMY